MPDPGFWEGGGRSWQRSKQIHKKQVIFTYFHPLSPFLAPLGIEDAVGRALEMPPPVLACCCHCEPFFKLYLLIQFFFNPSETLHIYAKSVAPDPYMGFFENLDFWIFGAFFSRLFNSTETFHIYPQENCMMATQTLQLQLRCLCLLVSWDCLAYLFTQQLCCVWFLASYDCLAYLETPWVWGMWQTFCTCFEF